MHDREDFCLLKIFPFRGVIIFEQPADFTRSTFERGRSARRVQRINLARSDHLRQRFTWKDGLNPDFRRQVQRKLFGPARLFFAALEIGGTRDRHAILVVENTAYPDGRGHLVLRVSDTLPDQILRFANFTVRIHVNARVPERA